MEFRANNHEMGSGGVDSCARASCAKDEDRLLREGSWQALGGNICPNSSEGFRRKGGRLRK